MKASSKPALPEQQAADLARFEEEFVCFLRNRSAFRRWMPTPDRFPLFCELVQAAKKFYAGLPALQRAGLPDIPFFYWGRGWLLRRNRDAAARPGEAYLDIRAGDNKTVMVTVAVALKEGKDRSRRLSQGEQAGDGTP